MFNPPVKERKFSFLLKANLIQMKLTNEELEELEIFREPQKALKATKKRVPKGELDLVATITYLPECPYPKVGDIITDKCNVTHIYLGSGQWEIHLPKQILNTKT